MKENDDAASTKCAKRKDVRGLVGVRGQRAPAVHQKQHQGERNNVYLKYIFISIFIINLGLQQ